MCEQTHNARSKFDAVVIKPANNRLKEMEAQRWRKYHGMRDAVIEDP
jgi:hypothetical protein